MWARNNADVARACLEVPPLTKQTHPYTTFDEYWQRRQWDFSFVHDDPHEREWAQRLVSHVLSAPLTFAYHFPYQPSQRICVVGARAEATLPLDYWREVLVASNINPEQPLKWKLDFVGPDVVAVKNHVTLRNDNSALTLRWLHSGYLHDMTDVPAWDGFVLFNPGLGHEHLRHGWLPTLENLLNTKKPMLLTAHSERDAHRDAALLQELLGRPVEYRANVFQSRITYKDPLSNDNHLVRSNSFFARIIIT
jgi:splicing suppressor protein 51